MAKVVKLQPEQRSVADQLRDIADAMDAGPLDEPQSVQLIAILLDCVGAALQDMYDAARERDPDASDPDPAVRKRWDRRTTLGNLVYTLGLSRDPAVTRYADVLRSLYNDLADIEEGHHPPLLAVRNPQPGNRKRSTEVAVGDAVIIGVLHGLRRCEHSKKSSRRWVAETLTDAGRPTTVEALRHLERKKDERIDPVFVERAAGMVAGADNPPALAARLLTKLAL